MKTEVNIQRLQVVPIPVQNVQSLQSTVKRVKRFKRVVRQHVIYVVSPTIYTFVLKCQTFSHTSEYTSYAEIGATRGMKIRPLRLKYTIINRFINNRFLIS